MKGFRKILLALSVLALTALCAVLYILNTGSPQSVSGILTESRFTLEAATTPQSIKAFRTEQGNYLFVPSCADTLRFQFDAHHAEIDGVTYYPGDALAKDLLSGTHTLSFFSADGSELENTTLEIITAGDIPTVFISTATGSYSSNTDKLPKEYCTINIVNPDGSDEYVNVRPYSDLIRGHGNSSWRDHEKRSYNLYLQFPADLFGMGESAEWVMLANAGDPTLIRNKLVYDYADALGLEYSPECVFADVYFDGLYHGTYLLCERLQSGEERIDIGDNGILFSMEVGLRLTGKDNEHMTRRGQRLVRVLPEANNGEWAQRFTNTVDDFEDFIYSDFTLSELEGYIDTDSWAKIGIIEELFADIDAWTTSQYFYIRPDSRIISAGPVWDFDTSSGNITGTLSIDKTNIVNLLEYKCDTNYLGEETPWFYRLMQNREFYDYVRTVFEREVYPDFEEYMLDKVDEYLNTLGQSRRMNDIRWYVPDIGQVSQLEGFLTRRLEFLGRIWVECEPFSAVIFKNTGVAVAYFENEKCTPSLYYYNWFFDAERTKPAQTFVPDGDTVLYAEVEYPSPR